MLKLNANKYNSLKILPQKEESINCKVRVSYDLTLHSLCVLFNHGRIL